MYAYADNGCPLTGWTMTDITGMLSHGNPSISYDGYNDEWVMCMHGGGTDGFYGYMNEEDVDAWTQVEIHPSSNVGGGCAIFNKYRWIYMGVV